MRFVLLVLLGIIAGFLLGVALSSFIGVIGWVFFGGVYGIKYLPVITSLLCAFLFPLIGRKNQYKKCGTEE